MSQTAVTGSGTSVDPFTIVTVVDVSTTGLRITETDTYVTGREGYRTDVAVANTTASPVSAVLWLPLTSGSHYFEGTFGHVRAAMSSGDDFPDTCDCASYEDNGAGLS